MLAESSGPAIPVTVVVDRPGWQVARLEFPSGTAIPEEAHEYDLVLIPLGEGLSIEVEHRPAAWMRGTPILITRGAPHRLWNPSPSTVQFICVRRAIDEPGPPPVSTESEHVTIERSNDSKYVRAVTVRFEREGQLRGVATPGAGATLFVFPADGSVRFFEAGEPF